MARSWLISLYVCNGAVGRVHQIVYNEGQHPPDLPVAVIVHFEKYAGPPFIHEHPKCIPVPPNAHLNGVIQIIYQGNNSHFKPGMHAITIHKSQGQTLQKAVIDIGKSEHSPGTTFVAISRLPHLIVVV